MQFAIYLSLAIALIGAAIYLFVSQPKYAKLGELGKISFFVGLLVFLLQLGPHLIGK